MIFEVLYCYSDAEMSLIEIKRTDIISEYKSKVFYWLEFINQKSLVPLHFVGMGQEGGYQYRLFEEGKLLFDQENAFWKERTLPVSALSKTLEIEIIRFLKGD